MKDDELLVELVESLKAQNERLTKQLDKRPRSLLGIAEMWTSFWNTIGGMWKDFWTSISAMWHRVWESEGSITGFVISTIVVTLTISVASWAILDEECPITKEYRTGRYHIGTSSTDRDCLLIYEDMTGGGTYYHTKCIEGRQKALEILEEIQKTDNKVRCINDGK